jgi:hypothetical protein
MDGGVERVHRAEVCERREGIDESRGAMRFAALAFDPHSTRNTRVESLLLMLQTHENIRCIHVLFILDLVVMRRRCTRAKSEILCRRAQNSAAMASIRELLPFDEAHISITPPTVSDVQTTATTSRGSAHSTSEEALGIIAQRREQLAFLAHYINIEIPMRDGILLAGDLYLPAIDGVPEEGQ